MERVYKNQLYPNAKCIPADEDIKKFKALINSILDIERITNEQRNTEIDQFITSIYNNELQVCEKIKWIRNTKINVIKGSIYKIKKYFLENNYLKDIRGGSMIIDELNKEAVIKVLNDKNYNKGMYSEKNLIYSGGGNILIIVPEGTGAELCKYLETEFYNRALTAMNAFEYITTTLKDFAYNYKTISAELNERLQERKKLKVYSSNIEMTEEIINNPLLKSYEDKKINDEDHVCSLCDIRNAVYYDEVMLCPSCLLKHKKGTEKNRFMEEYSAFTSDIKPEVIGSLDELGDEIAVIYGDGNNMGNIVMNIENVFEMMYFSRNLDRITKKSVYTSIKEAVDIYNKNQNGFNEKVKFEVIALGGDDIFIIVPAKHAFNIATNIINKFDKEFNTSNAQSHITMSIGMVISKSSTPIASLFKIAQDKLKSAKKITRDANISEGSIDIVEILGDVQIKDDKNREFPMLNSQFNNMVKVLKSSKISSSQLQKISYAKKNMIEEEFNLFYYYQESKNRKSNNKDSKLDTIDKVLEKLYIENEDRVYKRSNPYKINWDDLILIRKRA